MLVSQTVKDLVAGAGVEFEDRGEHELKGVPGSWRLYAVADVATHWDRHLGTDVSTLEAWTDAFIVDAVRSPIGKRNGTLASLRADELAGQVLNALAERNGLDPGEVEDVQMGCVSQVGEQGWNIARMAALVAGWSESVAGSTVDRQCGSSLQAAFNAASAVSSGQLDVVVAAGVESMSRVPMGSSGGDLSDTLLERFEIVPQGISAELIAEEWGLSRDELDAYSYESHRRALAAIEEGRFEREVVPVEVSNPHTGVLFGVDETPRADTSLGGAGGTEAGVPAGRQGDRWELEPDLRRRRRRARRE